MKTNSFNPSDGEKSNESDKAGNSLIQGEEFKTLRIINPKLHGTIRGRLKPFVDSEINLSLSELLKKTHELEREFNEDYKKRLESKLDNFDEKFYSSNLFEKETRPCTKCGKEAEIHFDSLVDGIPPHEIEACSHCGHFGPIE